MPGLSSAALIAVKCETTPGTDAVPSASDALVVYGLEVNPLGKAQHLGRDVRMGAHWTGLAGVAGTRAGTLRCSFYLAPSGTAGTAPGYGPLLHACGWQADVTAATNVVYTPASSQVLGAWGATSDKAGWCPVSIYAWMSDTAGGATAKLYKLTGCVGSMRMSSSAGKPIKVDCDLTGVYSAPTITSMPSPTLTSLTPVPMIAQTWRVSTDNSTWHEPVLAGWEFDMGSKVTMRERIASTTGYVSATLTGRKPRITIKVEEPQTLIPATGFDWWGAWTASTLLRFETPSFSLGSAGTGSGIQITHNRARLDAAPQKQGGDGVSSISLTLTPESSGAGDNEITLTYS